MNWLKHLKNSILKLFCKQVPFQIAPDELLVRGIGHHRFYSLSSGVLKREAFLPPVDSADVSLLRRKYTNDDFCKNHSMSIKMSGYSYCGLAIFFASDVEQINQESEVTINPVVLGTPIDKNNKYIKRPPVFLKDKGLPMHADLVYPYPMSKGQVNTPYRQFAQRMIKKAKYYSDPIPMESGKWVGEPLDGAISA